MEFYLSFTINFLQKKLLFAFIIFLTLVSSPVFSEQIKPNCEQEPNYDTEMVVSVKQDQFLIHEGIVLYRNEQKELLLPLKELFMALKLDYKQPKEGVFTSRIFNDHETLKIDYFNQTINLVGASENLYLKSSLKCYQGELYLSQSIFEKILPIKIEFNLQTLTLHITSQRLFPVHIEQKIKELTHNQVYISRNLSQEFLKNTKHIPSDTFLYSGKLEFGADTNSNYQASLFTNLKYHNTYLNTFLSQQNTQTLLTARVSSQFDKTYLKRIDAGNIHLPREEGIGQNYSGVGLSLTNDSLEAQFGDIVRLSLIAPAGWFAELTVDDKLIDFKTVPKEGLLAFNDVPVYFGDNRVKITLYGNKGEIKEYIRHFYVGSVYSYYKKIIYNFGVLEDKNTVNNIFNLKLGYGLTQNLLLQTSIWQQQNEHILKYTSIFTHNRFSLSLSGLSAYTQSTAGKGYLYSFNTRPFNYPLSFIFSGEKYSNYFGLSNAINYQENNALTISTVIPRSINLKLKYSQELTYSNILQQKYEIELSKRLWSINNTLSFNISESPTNIKKSLILRNSMMFLKNKLNLNLSNQFSTTDHKDNYQFNQASFNAVYRVTSNATISSSISIDQTAATAYNIKYSKHNKTFFYTLTLNHSLDDTRFSLSIGTNFFKSKTGLVFLSLSNPNKAQAKLEVELVKPNQKASPLSDIQVNVDGKVVKIEQAHSLLHNLPPDSTVSITLKPESLDDPNWYIENQTFVVQTAQGSYNEIKFKVYETGEIDGIVQYLLNKNINILPANGIEVELYDQNFTLVQKTLTAFDGYYLFNGILPGTYYIKVSDKFIKKNNFNKEIIKVELTGDQLFIYDVDFNLKQLQNKVSKKQHFFYKSKSTLDQRFSPLTPELIPLTQHLPQKLIQRIVEGYRIKEHRLK